PVTFSCQVPNDPGSGDTWVPRLAVRYPPAWLSMLSVPSAAAVSLTMCASALSPAGVMITYAARSPVLPGCADAQAPAVSAPAKKSGDVAAAATGVSEAGNAGTTGDCFTDVFSQHP